MTSDPIDRVHVSCFFYNNPDKFKLASLKAEGSLHRPDIRVTLDEKDDFVLLGEIRKRLADKGDVFSALDVMNVLNDDPGLLNINRSVRTKALNEG